LLRNHGKTFDLRGFAEAFGEAFDPRGFARAFREACDPAAAGRSFVAGFRHGAEVVATQVRRAAAALQTVGGRSSGPPQLNTIRKAVGAPEIRLRRLLKKRRKQSL
jgi:hypothetical protein